MIAAKSRRPYFEAWLHKARKRLATSGRLSEAALILAREEGGSVDSWRRRLRTLLEGEEQPSLDLLTRIDALLAPAKTAHRYTEAQELLF